MAPIAHVTVDSVGTTAGWTNSSLSSQGFIPLANGQYRLFQPAATAVSIPANSSALVDLGINIALTASQEQFCVVLIPDPSLPAGLVANVSTLDTPATWNGTFRVSNVTTGAITISQGTGVCRAIIMKLPPQNVTIGF